MGGRKAMKSKFEATEGHDRREIGYADLLDSLQEFGRGNFEDIMSTECIFGQIAFVDGQCKIVDSCAAQGL